MSDINKNFFSSSNPDSQKGNFVKLSLIVVAGLIILAIVIRLLNSPKKADTTVKLPNILKTDQTAKENFNKNFEALPEDNVSLSAKTNEAESQPGNNGLSSQIAQHDFSKGQMNEPENPKENKVNQILNKVMAEGEPQEEENVRHTFNPYPYSYEAGGRVEDSYLSPYWRRILSPEYKMIRDYTNSSITAYNDETREKTERVSAQIRNDEARNNPAPSMSQGGALTAGTVIKAVTLDRINSDFPTTVRCRITSPFELSGAICLLNTQSQNFNRITITPFKVIQDGRSLDIKGVIRSGLPGLTGSVDRHLVRKTVNPLAAAGLIAYGTVFGNRNNQINTEDAIRQQIIQEGLNIGVNELQKYSGDVPNTVDVKIGTSLEILLTEDLRI